MALQRAMSGGHQPRPRPTRDSIGQRPIRRGLLTKQMIMPCTKGITNASDQCRRSHGEKDQAHRRSETLVAIIPILVRLSERIYETEITGCMVKTAEMSHHHGILSHSPKGTGEAHMNRTPRVRRSQRQPMSNLGMDTGALEWPILECSTPKSTRLPVLMMATIQLTMVAHLTAIIAEPVPFSLTQRRESGISVTGPRQAA